MWTTVEFPRFLAYTEEAFRWSALVTTRHQQVFGMTSVAKYREQSAEDLEGTKDGLGGQALKQCVAVVVKCWDTLAGYSLYTHRPPTFHR